MAKSIMNLPRRLKGKARARLYKDHTKRIKESEEAKRLRDKKSLSEKFEEVNRYD